MHTPARAVDAIRGACPHPILVAIAAAMLLGSSTAAHAGINELRPNGPSPEPAPPAHRSTHGAPRPKETAPVDRDEDEGTDESDQKGEAMDSGSEGFTPAGAYTAQAKAAVDAHNFAQALELANQALARGEAKSGAYLQLGRAQFYQKNLASALESIRLGMEAGPSARLYNLRAAVEWTQGRTEMSLADSRKAITMDPHDPLPQLNLARNLAGRRGYSLAVAVLEKTVQIAPADARAHDFLGSVLGAMGRVPDAIRALERARATNPTDTALVKRLAHLRLRTSWAWFRSVWTQQNADVNGRKGMIVHCAFDVHGLKGRTGLVVAFFEYNTGASLRAKARSAYRTDKGFVVTTNVYAPIYDDASFNDIQLSIPYDELNMAKGHAKLSFWVQIRDTPSNGNGIGTSDRQYFDFDQR